MEKYQELLAREEAYLRQLSKEQWFSSMDRNSRYFYSLLKSRKNKNLILSILSGDDVITDEQLIEKEFISFFFPD